MIEEITRKAAKGILLRVIESMAKKFSKEELAQLFELLMDMKKEET